jgi:hypothetical protein
MPETNESTKTKQRKYDLIELYKFIIEYEDWYNKQHEQAATTDSGSNPGGTPPPPPGSNP